MFQRDSQAGQSTFEGGTSKSPSSFYSCVPSRHRTFQSCLQAIWSSPQGLDFLSPKVLQISSNESSLYHSRYSNALLPMLHFHRIACFNFKLHSNCGTSISFDQVDLMWYRLARPRDTRQSVKLGRGPPSLLKITFCSQALMRSTTYYFGKERRTSLIISIKKLQWPKWSLHGKGSQQNPPDKGKLKQVTWWFRWASACSSSGSRSFSLTAWSMKLKTNTARH